MITYLRCPKCGKNNIKLTTRRGSAVHYKCLDCGWKFHVYRINRDWVPCDEFNKITTAQFRGTDIISPEINKGKENDKENNITTIRESV